MGSVRWVGTRNEITSSVSPLIALALTCCTSKITDGNNQSQGVPHHGRRDMIYLALRDAVSSHPTICPCHSLPQQRSCVASSLRTWNCLTPRAVIRDGRARTCKQHLIMLLGVYRNWKLESSVTTANKAFSSGPRGLYSCVVNELTVLTREGWTSFENYSSSNLKPYQTSSEVLSEPRKNLFPYYIRVSNCYCCCFSLHWPWPEVQISHHLSLSQNLRGIATCVWILNWFYSK